MHGLRVACVWLQRQGSVWSRLNPINSLCQWKVIQRLRVLALLWIIGLVLRKVVQLPLPDLWVGVPNRLGVCAPQLFLRLLDFKWFVALLCDKNWFFVEDRPRHQSFTIPNGWKPCFSKDLIKLLKVSRQFFWCYRRLRLGWLQGMPKGSGFHARLKVFS